MCIQKTCTKWQRSSVTGVTEKDDEISSSFFFCICELEQSVINETAQGACKFLHEINKNIIPHIN